MLKELTTSAKYYVEKKPPQIWQEFLEAADVYNGFGWHDFIGTNPWTGRDVPGVVAYSLDENENIGRIVIARLTSKRRRLRDPQILLEHWPECHFFGPDTVASMVNLRQFLEESQGSMDSPGNRFDLNLLLTEINDTTWRTAKPKIISFSDAGFIVNNWFGIDFRP